MIAIRQIQEIKSGKVTVLIPPHFHAKKVEIIVLPIEESANGEKGLEHLLLTAPTLTEDELKEFEQVKEWMSQWNLKAL